MRWRVMSPAVSNWAVVAICLPADHGWRIFAGRPGGNRRSTDVLNTALAKARGTLEFDAPGAPTAATFGSAEQPRSRSSRCGTAPRRSACSPRRRRRSTSARWTRSLASLRSRSSGRSS